MQSRVGHSPEKWKNLDLRFRRDEEYDGGLGRFAPDPSNSQSFFQMNPLTGY